MIIKQVFIVEITSEAGVNPNVIGKTILHELLNLGYYEIKVEVTETETEIIKKPTKNGL